ncbi:MAG TPA: AEC family transporter [Casimicrobiaceae bacterium]|nr:AEC family transporter [Casimicrobiaceae bacterium]
MASIPQLAGLTAPLFALVALGYVLARVGGWSGAVADALAKFVFAVAVPALLFRMMSGFQALPHVDPMLLVAYFGGTLVVYALAIVAGRALFALDGTGASVFGMGTVFANTVLLGVPVTQVTLGDRAIPAISLVIIFNALVLWTLVTVSVEWARHRQASVAGLAATARDVLLNPIVGSILAGTAFGYTGLPLPAWADGALTMVAQAAVPLSLIALGMSLWEYGVREGWRTSAAIVVGKLALLPLAVYGLARLLGLPALETQAITVLAAMPVGANVYLMSKAFGALGGPVSSSIVLSTALSAVVTPVVIALTGGIR